MFDDGFRELQIPCIHVRTSVFGLGASHDEKAVGLGGRELCVGRIHYRSHDEFQWMMTLHRFRSGGSADKRGCRHATNQRRWVWALMVDSLVSGWLMRLEQEQSSVLREELIRNICRHMLLLGTIQDENHVAASEVPESGLSCERERTEDSVRFRESQK